MKKRLPSTIKKHLNRRNYIITGVILLILIIIGVSLANGNGHVSAQVEKGVFQKETKVAGKVVAKEEALLGFTKSGRVTDLSVKVGDEVEMGQVIARLDQNSAQASVALASSNLAYEDARLDELARGSRQEELRIQESKVNEAQVNSQIAKESLYRELVNSYVVADDAVRFKIDLVFDVNNGGRIYPLFSDTSLRQEIDTSRREVKYLLDDWKDYTETLNVTNITLADVSKTKEYLSELRTFADLVSEGVGEFQSNASTTQTTIDSYKASVSAGRTAIQNQITTLTSKEESYLVANQQTSQSEDQLALLQAGASSEEIAAQRARVLAEQARLADAQTLLSDNTIRAPFKGKIVQIDVEEGESIGANEVIISIISDAGLEIESYIPEVFVGSVTEGDVASIIFDAYPSRKFQGRVEEVEPKETLRDGISTYRTTMSFDPMEANILLGMTTNITILAEERPDTIMVPLEAVQYEDGKAYVSVQKEGEKEPVRVDVEVGDVDSSGRQEVLSGSLLQGDTVVYVKRN